MIHSFGRSHVCRGPCAAGDVVQRHNLTTTLASINALAPLHALHTASGEVTAAQSSRPGACHSFLEHSSVLGVLVVLPLQDEEECAVPHLRARLSGGCGTGCAHALLHTYMAVQTSSSAFKRRSGSACRTSAAEVAVVSYADFHFAHAVTCFDTQSLFTTPW